MLCMSPFRDANDNRNRDVGLSASLTEFAFDGVKTTARVEGDDLNVLCVEGYRVNDSDEGRGLVIRGGTNFILGSYRVKTVHFIANSWTLDHPCAVGAARGMVGVLILSPRKPYQPVAEFFNGSAPDNPARGEARDRVLRALNRHEPEILQSLKSICFLPQLLEPEMTSASDWPGPYTELQWGHIQDAQGNLKPLRLGITEWARGGSSKTWNLCNNEGGPIDWIADAAVQTLIEWTRRKGVPKVLRWENFGLDAYWSVDGEEGVGMLDLDGHFDRGAGFVRVVPAEGTDADRLSNREQRSAKKEYRSRGKALGLKRLGKISSR